MADSAFEVVAKDPERWRWMAQIHRTTANHLAQQVKLAFEEWIQEDEDEEVVFIDEEEEFVAEGGEPGDEEPDRVALFFAYLYHAGLAVELAAKAVLVRRDPTVVMDGKLKLPADHNLSVLVRNALQQEPTASERDLLQRYEHAVRWFTGTDRVDR